MSNLYTIKLSDDNIKKITTMLLSGNTIPEIAKEVMVATKTVGRIKKRVFSKSNLSLY